MATILHRFRGGVGRARRGVGLIDLIVIVACTMILLGAGWPIIERSRVASMTTQSQSNLALLGLGHALYAAEWNGRQYTAIDDRMSQFGNNVSAFLNYETVTGNPHPPIVLGWGVIDSDPANEPFLFAYRTDFSVSNAALTIPMNFTFPIHAFGSFRLPNARAFRQYVAARFYAAPFYAPADSIVWPRVEPLLDDRWEYVDAPKPAGIDTPRWASYCLSPAAMFHPDVMRHPDAGGWQNPWSIDHAFRSPALAVARHPSLKTFMIEHHWLQNAPDDPCNPAFAAGSYPPCEPYYFNHGLNSAPSMLFYDLSVRAISNPVTQAVDQATIDRTGHGIWSRDTPFGTDGYFGDMSVDGSTLSHHILTTDGILGRDTTAGQ